MRTNLSAYEKRQFVADSKAAAARGLSLDAHRAARAGAIAELTAFAHGLMEEKGAIDPVEVLPEILIHVQETAVAEARAAAKQAVKDELRNLLRKLTP